MTTIDRVADDLGESVDWLLRRRYGNDTEDCVIWVYGLGHEQLMAFTNFGIETLVDLIKIHKDDPTLLRIEKAKPFIEWNRPHLLIIPHANGEPRACKLT